MIAREKILPDLFAVVSYFLQDPDRVDSRQGGDNQQAAEAGDKRQAGAQDKTVKSAVQTHIGCRAAVFWGRYDVHVSQANPGKRQNNVSTRSLSQKYPLSGIWR